VERLLNLASGKTLTINGRFKAGLYQVFSGDGSVVLNNVSMFFPEWWGTVSDGVTNDNAALDKAIAAVNAVNGSIQFRAGRTYAINAVTGMSFDGITVYGNNATISIDNAASYTAVYLDGAVVHDLNLVGGGDTPEISFGFRVSEGANDSTLYNCSARNFSYEGLYVNSSTSTVKLIDCHFYLNYRNDIAVVNAEGIYIDGGLYGDDANVYSVACIDIEPNSGKHVKRVHINNCVTKGRLSIAYDYGQAESIIITNTYGTTLAFASSEYRNILKLIGSYFDNYAIGDRDDSKFYGDIIILDKLEGDNLLHNSYIPNVYSGMWSNVYFSSYDDYSNDYLKISANDTDPAFGAVQRVSVSAETTYSMGCYARTISGNPFYNRLRIQMRDAVGNLLKTVVLNFSLLDDLSKFTCIFTTPANTEIIDFGIIRATTSGDYEFHVKKLWLSEGIVTDYTPCKGDTIHMKMEAIPTTGTWALGDKIYKINPVAGGEEGWVCTTQGTFSAATDNTGDTTTGSYEITGMTDTADFHVGDFVTVSAGFPAGVRRIMCKTATSVTLDKAATSDNANVTVSTSDPVFKKMAILES